MWTKLFAMTLTLKPKINKSIGSQIPENVKNFQTAIALKRYLDLTLTGTKKSLAEHGRKGRKGQPPSPYSFDKPQIQGTIRQILQDETDVKQAGSPPRWVQKINERTCKHSGEAPLFAERLLPSSKTDQLKTVPSRPQSGLSTKSAPILINGEMYYRPTKKHTFLHASNRPYSAKDNRETRASVLRNKHRVQAMSALPSNDTHIRLREIKRSKPKTQQLNKDLLPIPCHTGETAHSFIVGARYNCTSHMDARSYARLGLYVPRHHPKDTFLKVYKGDDASTDVASDTDYVGVTSVRVGEVSYHDGVEKQHPSPNRSLPPPHVRKVVREGWLEGQPTETKPPPYKPPSGQRRSVTSSSKRSSNPDKKKSVKSAEANQSRSDSTLTMDRSTKSKSRSRSRVSVPSNFNLQGRSTPVSPELERRSRASRTEKQAELE